MGIRERVIGITDSFFSPVDPEISAACEAFIRERPDTRWADIYGRSARLRVCVAVNPDGTILERSYFLKKDENGKIVKIDEGKFVSDGK